MACPGFEAFDAKSHHVFTAALNKYADYAIAHNPIPKRSKEIFMDTLVFDGKTYTRQSDKWVDSRHTIVHEGLQKDLNREYAKQLEPATLSVKECIAHGDRFKNSSSTGLALKFYEEASMRADRITMAYILPRMTSCYRQNGMPQKAIDILEYASKTFGRDIVTPVLLTSVAGAYCDLGDYARAKKCCDRAYAQLNGKRSDELSLVYKRIQKATE